jgi:hypothetical protein
MIETRLDIAWIVSTVAVRPRENFQNVLEALTALDRSTYSRLRPVYNDILQDLVDRMKNMYNMGNLSYENIDGYSESKFLGM